MPSQEAEYVRRLIWYWLIASSLSYPIYHFIIHETPSGTLLEFSRLKNDSIYSDFANSTSKVAVVMLTNSPYQRFDGLEDLVPDEVHYIYDQREFYKLRTPQVHVLVRSTHSTVLPGIAKFMKPLKKMNTTDVADFIKMSIAVERDILSPNIEKALCYPDQQVVLMNTILGNYRSFTMYVVNWVKAANSTDLIDDLNGEEANNATTNGIQLTPALAKEILNPIRCDLTFRQNAIDVDT